MSDDSDSDDNDNVDYDLMNTLGLSIESIQTTEGKQALDDFHDIMDKLLDPTFSKATRKEMATMMGMWHHLSSEESKSALYRDSPEKANRLFDVIKTLIPTKDVKVAGNMVEGMSALFTTTDYGQLVAPNVVDCMREAVGRPIAASKPLKKDGEPQFRAECVSNLLGCLPCMGINDSSKMPEDTVDIIASFIYTDTPCVLLQNSAYGSLSMLAMNNADLFIGHLGPIFKAIKAYPNASSILGQIQGGFEADPQSYIDNIGYFFEIGVQTSSTIIQQISTKDALALAPHVDKIIDIAKNDPMFGSMAMMWLKDIALADETGTNIPLNMVEDLYDTAFKGNGTDVTYAMLVGACRKEADKTILLLIRMLQDGRLSSYAPSVILNDINNLKDDSSGPTFFEPLMPTIKSFESANAALVQQIEDWAAGRSLENLSGRVGVVEARIEELNHKVQDSCKNFEEVQQYMDDHMDELKEFVATVVKKLPSPTRLTVVSGLRKKIKLHLPCCRQHPPGCKSPYGKEFTVETREWNKWLKIGFSVAKLGKCVIDVGMGNPLGLAKTGVDAISEIYAAYKSKDDADFNTYITSPFLSSAEQDKLLEQLHEGSFFSNFQYDAQLAGWHCIPCTDFPGQSIKMIEMENGGLTGYGTSTKEKGKFFNMTAEDGYELYEKVTELVTGEDKEEKGKDKENEDEEEVDKVELAMDAYILASEIREDKQKEDSSDRPTPSDEGDANNDNEEQHNMEGEPDQTENQEAMMRETNAPQDAPPVVASSVSASTSQTSALLIAQDAKIRSLQRQVRELERQATEQASDAAMAKLKRQMGEMEQRVAQLEAHSTGTKCCAIS